MKRRLSFMAATGAAAALFTILHWSDADAKVVFAGGLMGAALFAGWHAARR